ncbi:hypothetical protein chiPu_0023655, partial [Chiloscyllium punctatum]|nr:hypothetical protein [Chiloscyllium punctatum]
MFVSTLSGGYELPSNLQANFIDIEKKGPPPSFESESPVFRRCEIAVPTHLKPREAWLESLRGYTDDKLGIVDLHPDVFAVPP